MSKSQFSPELRAKISQDFLNGEASAVALASKYGVHEETIRKWAYRYEANGLTAFERGSGNTSYSAEFKTECVECYLRGEMSVNEIVAKYNISSNCVVREWIKKYNANKELRDYKPIRRVYMAEARRETTKEERLEIVQYCIHHDRDYKGTAVLYNVSYSQVYSWVRKFDARGEEGLTDKRGRHKKDDELDELEQLRRENTRLKKQLKEEEMTVELLKKVKEYERK